MKKMNTERLKKLEEKWLAGSISDDEAKLYARWYNWKQKEEVNIPADIAHSEAEHKEKLFNKIVNKLNAGNNEFSKYYKSIEKNTIRRIGLLKYGIAASVLVIIGLGAIWLYSNKKATQVADIMPGKSGLVLTLNDGKQMMLDSVQDGLISEQMGVKVYKKNGRIEYEGKPTADMVNIASTDVGRQYQIMLPDGSLVWLNNRSELKYPLSFTASNRMVQLKGEAYFEVRHLKGNAPFIVETGNKSIQVLGTHFNINAYGDDGTIIATLLEGSIAMQTAGTAKTIHPNEAAVSPVNGSSIAIQKVVASKSVMWIDREFNFEDVTLEDIMRALERWYGVKVVYEPNVDKGMRFNGATPMNQNLSETLNVLELGGIHFRLEDKTLTVMK